MFSTLNVNNGLQLINTVNTQFTGGLHPACVLLPTCLRDDVGSVCKPLSSDTFSGSPSESPFLEDGPEVRSTHSAAVFLQPS